MATTPLRLPTLSCPMLRNQILLDAAEDEGITVSSKEMEAVRRGFHRHLRLQDHGHAVRCFQGPGQADCPPVCDAAEALQEEGGR